jgi:hypothetical protein
MSTHPSVVGRVRLVTSPSEHAKRVLGHEGSMSVYTQGQAIIVAVSISPGVFSKYDRRSCAAWVNLY